MGTPQDILGFMMGTCHGEQPWDRVFTLGSLMPPLVDTVRAEVTGSPFVSAAAARACVLCGDPLP